MRRTKITAQNIFETLLIKRMTHLGSLIFVYNDAVNPVDFITDFAIFLKAVIQYPKISNLHNLTYEYPINNS